MNAIQAKRRLECSTRRPGSRRISVCRHSLNGNYVTPDFIGSPYATAAATIIRAGLKLALEIDIRAPSTPEGQAPPQPGTVIGQTPEAVTASTQLLRFN